jgi:hypothetical protein
MPFLEGGSRLAGRAVKGAVFAFTGAQRKPLTGEADGLGAAYFQEGQRGRRHWHGVGTARSIRGVVAGTVGANFK